MLQRVILGVMLFLPLLGAGQTGAKSFDKQPTHATAQTDEQKPDVIAPTGLLEGNQTALNSPHTCGEPLIDPRDGQTYATKLMKDGRCWMVENLRFGKCDATTFGQYRERTAKDQIASGYYGVCIASTETGGGNLYNWQAAMNHADAVYESTGNPSGNVNAGSPTQWQGICPAGWHLPSGGRMGEFKELYTALGSKISNLYPGTGADGWRGVLGGVGIGTSVTNGGSRGDCWSSTYYSTYIAQSLYFSSDNVGPYDGMGKGRGSAVRCLKNYEQTTVSSPEQKTEAPQNSKKTAVIKKDASCGESFTDPRDGQTYQTKPMNDGRCWMVENLRFGKCNAKTFNKYWKRTAKDQIASGYYGVCIASTETGGGNLYNWQAAMNAANAVFETSDNPSGNVNAGSPTQWQGICPAGWHLPSGGSTGEFQQLYTALGSKTSTIYPGTGADDWRGVLAGYGNETSVTNAGSRGDYWSSTYYNAIYAYSMYFNSDDTSPQDYLNKNNGFAVRCLKNY